MHLSCPRGQKSMLSRSAYFFIALILPNFASLIGAAFTNLDQPFTARSYFSRSVLPSKLKVNYVEPMSSSKANLCSKTIDDDDMGEGLTLGFIGCGTIASAITTGLLTQKSRKISHVYVSKRSEEKSTALCKSFPGRVTVCDDNQDILNNSKLLFLCVLPQQEQQVLSDLDFEQQKVLISLVATSKLDKLVETSKLDPKQVFKMICLPPVAKLRGTCLLVPPDETAFELQTLFSTLGGECIECQNESIMDAMMIPGCLMGPIYGLLRQNRDWLKRQGVPAKDASYFVGRQYLSIIQDAEQGCEDEERFDELIAEQTPGGLNEQALKNLEQTDFFQNYDRAMDAILGRLTGETDGSIKETEN